MSGSMQTVTLPRETAAVGGGKEGRGVRRAPGALKVACALPTGPVGEFTPAPWLVVSVA